jgi:signal transduction histidine kinase
VPLELRDLILEQHPQWKPEGLDNGSAGLSLAIAKEIVEAHGGRISLDSSIEGSTFVIQLPRSRCI